MIVALAVALIGSAEIKCSTADPPSAVCCAEIKRVLKRKRLARETREVLGAYFAKQCQGAEWAQKKDPRLPGGQDRELSTC
jgi:hypothetical protein